MRTSARTAGTVGAAAAIALLVSGCGGSGDNGKSGAAAGRSNVPAEVAPGKSGGGRGSLAGVWDTKAISQHFVLTIAGDAVSLLRYQKTCTGRVMDTGKKSLTLKCPGGTGEERTNGTVQSVDAKSLKVKWNGGETDNYFRVANAPKKLPTDPDKLRSLVPGG